MKYVNVNEIAAKWNLSERSVRNYCAHGKIPGVILDGKTWRIPEDAVKPVRKKRAEKIANDLLTRLKMEKEAGIPGGIYHKVQIELTYNSNHMEGSRLTHDQTRYIFETNTIGIQDEVVNVDDIVETANHFRCIDQIIELANYPLSEAFIKQLHYILNPELQIVEKRGLLLVSISVLKMKSEEAQQQSLPMYPEKCGIY
jgi:hypothetical protein